MISYEIILQQVKKKIDRIIAETNSVEDNMIKSPVTINGKYEDIHETFDKNWTHSFLTGMVAYLADYYKEEQYIAFMLKYFSVYQEYIDTHLDEISHDIGFLYSLYAVALYKLTGDKKARILALRAADELAKRHHYESGVIVSFARIDEKKPTTIADDFMNIQLLLWAYRETGNLYYKRICEHHTRTCMHSIIRPDYTVCHAYEYDYSTGNPIGERNWCGFSVGSCWSRGLSWVIYGMVSMYEVTKEDVYAEAVLGLAGRFLTELGDELIPLYDFRLPMGEKKTVDTSAALIFAAALHRIENVLPVKYLRGRLKNAKQLAADIFSAVTENYMVSDTNDNLIDGAFCEGPERGCIWGDYFFVEVLMRLIKGKDVLSFWI